MHRFYLPPSAVAGDEITLDERESHHAATVVRLRERETVTVLDGAGSEFLCEVIAVDKRTTRLRVRSQDKINPLPYQITLLQAMTKGKSMDFIIQKATELCVHRIVPLVAGRSVVKVEDVESRLDKWRAIAIGSIKQCGCPWMPIIEAPVTPAEFFARNEVFDLPLIASLQGNTRHPRACVEAFVQANSRLPETLAVWIGPEGDFEPSEVNAVLSAGYQPITLGRVILRSETAALYCLATLNYEMQAPRG